MLTGTANNNIIIKNFNDAFHIIICSGDYAVFYYCICTREDEDEDQKWDGWMTSPQTWERWE